MKELWKDIPGDEGSSQASDLGRVRSIPRIRHSRNRYTGEPFARLLPGKVLAPGRYCTAGHLSVVLGRGTPGKPVHQLVLLTFVGPPPDGEEVRHLDGDPTNNALSNLQYGTRTENILDVYRQGKAWRTLDLADVGYIRFALHCGFSGSSLAREFGVSPSCISAIKTGRAYSWAR